MYSLNEVHTIYILLALFDLCISGLTLCYFSSLLEFLHLDEIQSSVQLQEAS